MSFLPPRFAMLLLAVVAGGGFVSCTSDSGPDGNIFLSDRAPRYGYGGTDKPQHKYGATETPVGPRGETRYLNERRSRDTPPRQSSTEEAVVEGVGDDNGGSEEQTEAPPRRIEPTPDPEPSEPTPKPAVAEDIPYATPVPGQEGKVYSPFHNGGYVDVSGMPSGSKARCPYTKKVFRVP